MKVEKKTEDKKVSSPTFSKKIDSAITGYALGISFLGIGAFLLLQPDYFMMPIISYIVGSIIGILGFIGIGIEMSKGSSIKGVDDFAIGTMFIIPWLIGYVKIHTLWLNIILFFFLIFGCFEIFRGLLEIGYSIFVHKEVEEKGNRRKGIFINLILFLTQLCALALAIINIWKALTT